MDKNELTFESVFTITQMLEKMKATYIIDELEDKLQVIDDKYKEKIKAISDEKSIEELTLQCKQEKKNVSGKEIIKFIICKPHVAKDEVYELVGQYLKLDIEAVKKLGLKTVLITFKAMIKDGLIDVIKEAMGDETLNTLKKTL